MCLIKGAFVGKKEFWCFVKFSNSFLLSVLWISVRPGSSSSVVTQ